MVSAQTTAERWALFSQFGQPAVLHENNNNAPQGGTFTFVMYTETAVMVDWILRPQKGAARPPATRLLWDNAGIPPALPAAVDSPYQRANEAAEMAAFFWMMSAVVLKHLHDMHFTGVIVIHGLKEGEVDPSVQFLRNTFQRTATPPHSSLP
jgi:hypothetical protein